MPQHRFKKGEPRPATAGRVAGTPNKRTLEAREILESLHCDPLTGMAAIAMDEQNSPELRGKMFAELAGYIYPKRKAIEVTATIDFSDFESRLVSARQRIEHEQPSVHIN